MQHISQLLQPKTELSKITNERQLLVHDFLQELNNARTGTKFKPLPVQFVAKKMAHLSLSDLKFFYSQCKRSASFTKLWWWALKPQGTGDK